jgi:hypothetical protein
MTHRDRDALDEHFSSRRERWRKIGKAEALGSASGLPATLAIETASLFSAIERSGENLSLIQSDDLIDESACRLVHEKLHLS